MAAIVHHGGAGTSAAALKAGVPSVVVPFFGDQPFWAHRLLQLGVSPAPIPKSSLTVDKLAEAIAMAVSDETMRQRVKAFGNQIRAENGVQQAVAAFHQRYFSVNKDNNLTKKIIMQKADYQDFTATQSVSAESTTKA
jgi:UDP:flavonoid glycosyltransferase YjiC (YdhE family)